jgi:hypothetical protein
VLFERKILRRIYGPIQDCSQWRIRYKELYGEPDLVTCIKLKRLRRMEGTRIPKKVFKAKFEGVRSVGKDGKMRCNRMLPVSTKLNRFSLYYC